MPIIVVCSLLPRYGIIGSSHPLIITISLRIVNGPLGNPLDKEQNSTEEKCSNLGDLLRGKGGYGSLPIGEYARFTNPRHSAMATRSTNERRWGLKCERQSRES